jgi:glycerol-3-phosphate acyltransferase PlsY
VSRVSAAGSVLLVAFAYAVGAIPWGVVLGKFFAKTDLREHGSQSTGATNAYRVLGAKISIAVLVLDLLKGVVPVVIARIIGASDWVVGAVAVATVVGHCWSVFIHFSGGKGVATGSGALIGLTPWVLLILPIMIAIVYRWRYVSLASITAAALAAVAMLIAAALGHLPLAYAVAAAIITGVIIERHRGNIERLRAGTERKFTKSRSASPA